MAEGGPPQCQTQKEEIRNCLVQELKKGDTWYLLDTKWYQQWKKYIGYDIWDTECVGEDSANPGPIDSSPLLKDDGKLQEHLTKDVDYMLLPVDAWNRLVSWYGVAPGQGPISRYVTEQGGYAKHYKVEVYLWKLKLCEYSNLDKTVLKQCSRASTIAQLEKKMREMFGIKEDKDVRLWNRYMSNTYEHLSEIENSLQDSRLYPGQVIVIEQKNDDDTWPRQVKSTRSNNSSSTSNTKTSTRSYSSYEGGVSQGSDAYKGGRGSATPGLCEKLKDEREIQRRKEELELKEIKMDQQMKALETHMAEVKLRDELAQQEIQKKKDELELKETKMDQQIPITKMAEGGPQGSTSSYNSDEGGRVTPGLCGLSNLGNTCFMNSALQCMSNVPILSEYFLSGKWKDDLNPANPLSMRGEIAESYAELVQTMWCGKYSYTLPRAFKLSVGRFAPQFSGNQKQDSQQLVALLLDGLHQDLNRIKSKPYVELTDANNRDDKIVAKEAWDNYRKRNDSVIIDIFHGLLKSTVTCPQCDQISVTFHPFGYLSLPVPIKKERLINVTWVPMSSEEKPQTIRLTVPKAGGMTDLRKALSKIVDVPHEMIMVTDVYNHRFHRIFKEDESLTHILDSDVIYTYEMSVRNSDDPNIVVLPVYLRERGRARPSSNYGGRDQLCGIPLMLSVKGKVTYNTLYDVILVQMRRYVRLPGPQEEWWKDEDKEDMDTNHENDDIEDGSGGNNYEVSKMDVGEGDDELEDNMTDNDDSKSVKAKRLFSLTAVNSCGNVELKPRFIDDGKPLKITAKTYVAVDWYSAAKKKFYNEPESEAVAEHESVKNTKAPKKQVIQLKDCLHLFTEAEQLSDWYCPSCKKHQQATKKCDIWSLPDVLIIHLKRFSYNGYVRDKLDAMVEFPIKDMLLDEFVINNKLGKHRYDLMSVSNHYGGLEDGHYTAYGLNKTTNEWYYFDDSSVSQSSEEQVLSKAAYVLIYQKKGLPKS